MEKEGRDDEEAASPPQLRRQKAEEHRKDDAGYRGSAVGHGEGQRAIPVHPGAQSHESRDVRCSAADETDDALV